jgi:hypothetical protein
MNTKYASKPNFNPNEPNLFGFVSVIPAQAGIQTPDSLLFYISICAICEICGSVSSKNKPNFFTTKYALSISKTRKWRLKTDPKKRNEPICG